MIIGILTVANFIVWLFIIARLSDHFGSWLVYQITLYNHPEDNVCCCGAYADDHSIFDNHAIKTEREWYIECNKPQFK